MAAGIGALVAHVCFWILLAYGWFWDDLGGRTIAIFLILWLAGWFGVALIPHGGGMFFSWVALLDVALVFIVFKGDVRLT